MRNQFRLVYGLRLRVPGTWTVITGLVVWFLVSVYFPQEYPDWPTWLQWLTATGTALLLLTTAVIHELAHTVVARRRHVVVKGSAAFLDGSDGPALSRPARPVDESCQRWPDQAQIS